MSEGLGLAEAMPGEQQGVGLSSMAPIDLAHSQLNLTPEERGLYERHLANLNGPGKVMHPDGSISTLYQMSVSGPENKIYNIPSVYNGKIVEPQQAIANAERQGWHTFPAYPDSATAEARYQQMHEFMDQDVGNYLQGLKKKR
jgi:hypothetical protein